MKTTITKYVKALGIAAASAAVALLMPACNNVIYDYEGDCEPTYTLKLKYDKNLKWADAFANEVKSVRLFAFDQNGNIVKEWFENSQILQSDNYSIDLDLPAGKYHLVAWCGTQNPQATDTHFVVPTPDNYSLLEHITCRLNRYTDDSYPAVSNKRLEFMFHGAIDVDLPADDDGGDYLYTMPLTKDTNHIRIILQHLSGEDLKPEQFDFRIEDDNGHYAHDNSLLDDEIITYRAYNTSSGVAGVGKEDIDDTRSILYVNGVIADLSVARLMADHNRKMKLTISNDKGETVAQVPIIDYALLAKEYYEEAYGRKMTDQEFLDREDEYVMTFFLDQNKRWIDTSILIHSWRVVLHDYELH